MPPKKRSSESVGIGMSNKRALVVDGNSILNRAFYGIRALSTKDGQPTNAIYGLINIISRHFEAIQPEYAVIAFDLKAPTFRHVMYDEYKAGRRPTPDELLAQFAPAKECARAIGFHVVEMEGYEADDILGTVARLTTEQDADCYLVTGDRDALQLINERVHVLLATNTDTIDYTEQVFFEKYGVKPSQFVDVKALMGDTSDHIPGVPGIGEKTALRLIADYQTLDGVYQALADAPLTPSVKAKLENGRDSAYLSQKLARICCAVPLDSTLQAYRTSGIDRAEALRLFTRLEFSAFIKRMALTETANEEQNQTKWDEKAVEVNNLNATFGSGSSLALFADDAGLSFFDGVTLCRLAWESMSGKTEKGVLSDFLALRPQLICHDCKSLYHALGEKGIFFRNCSFDTMLAAYVINAGEGDYSIERLALAYLGSTIGKGFPTVVAIHQLHPILAKRVKESEQERILYEIEMPLSTVLADMEEQGFRLYCEGIKAYGEQLDVVSHELAGRVFSYAGKEFNLNSPKQLGEVLFGEGGMGLPYPKKTKGAYSTSAEILEKLRPYHPIIEDILDYRQVTKLKSTYVEGLLRVVGSDSQVHTNFKQTGTATGRLSSAEPNLQNIPIRTELGRELRRFFIPSAPNRLLIDADYSQIELRLLAAITEDENMCRAFREGTDIHTSTASTVFGVSPEDVTLEMRKRAKAINFGILYGMGEFSLAEDLHISRKQAKEYIDHYLASYPKIDAYLKNIKQQAADQGFVTTLLGRRRYIPELSSPNKMVRSFGERVAMNSPIQGSAADIIKLAMIAVHRRLKESGLDARLILQVHDELLIEADAACRDEALALLQEEMENAVKLCVPLDVSVAVGDNWFDAK